MNFLSQTLHAYFFSPLWPASWSLRLPIWVNFLLQMLHSYFFSSLWTALWTFRVVYRVNCCPHSSHSYRFCTSWILSCILRAALVLNPLLHSRHLCDFSFSSLTFNGCLSQFSCLSEPLISFKLSFFSRFSKCWLAISEWIFSKCSSRRFFLRIVYRIGCIHMDFLLYGFFDVF